jgi:Fe-S-cluster containining protein
MKGTLSMDEIMDRLEKLYHNLDDTFIPVEGNPCADSSCMACCSLQHIVMHRISLMEMEYLSRHAGREKAEIFKDYIARRKDEAGNPLYLVCPLYCSEKGGCTVYMHRPVSCRIFGRYFLEGGTIPEQCSFKDKGTWFRASEYFKVIPYAEEFRSLHRQYLGKRPYTLRSMSEELKYAEGFGVEPIVDDQDFLDVIDRALHLELKGKLQEAYDLFMASEKEYRQSPYFYYYFGNLCDEMERHEEAVGHFKRAMELKDDDSLFHFRYALDMVIGGDQAEARSAFEKVIDMNPQNAMALGYLGYIHLNGGDLKGAAEYFEKALALDPDQQYFRFRLALTYLGLRRGEEAEVLLRQIVDFEPMKNDVAYLLGEIEKIKKEE